MLQHRWSSSARRRRPSPCSDAPEFAPFSSRDLLSRSGSRRLVLRAHRSTSTCSSTPPTPTRPGARSQNSAIALVREVTPGVGHHASVWTAPGRVPVEVHDRLWGADGEVWQVLERETEAVTVAGETVEVPNEPARCLVVALHAAHHGVGKDADALRPRAGDRGGRPHIMDTCGRACARGRRVDCVRRRAGPRALGREATRRPGARRAGADRRDGARHRHADRRRRRLLLALPAAMVCVRGRASCCASSFRRPASCATSTPGRGTGKRSSCSCMSTARSGLPAGRYPDFSNGAGFARVHGPAATSKSTDYRRAW